MSDETALADLLELVFAGRPERLTELAVGQIPAELRPSVGAVADAVATLALALDPVQPSGALRDRILATLEKRQKRAPRRALLVCDMIRDHLTAGCPLDVPRAHAIVDAIANRIAQSRSSGVPVVYIVDRHDADDPELEEWGAHAIEGTDGAEVWPSLAPEPGDKVVTKPSYSGFFETELERALDELAVDSLVLTGCATEVQLMSTATDALQRGFAVEIPADCQAGASETSEKLTMRVLAALVPYVPARRTRLEKIALRP
jgi:nicotinamidase/pyrazinamidase